MTGNPLPPRVIQAAAALVRRRTGLVFSEPRQPAFHAAIQRAIRDSRSTAPDAYLARLSTEADLLDALVAQITVGESYFFRDPAQFELLRERIIPELLSRRPPEVPMRVWSAGCAAGEEPYSVAIMLREQGLSNRARIVASDLSRAALARATSGAYSRWSVRGVADDLVRRYFTPSDGHLRLASEIRASVEFRYLNLAEDVYPSLTAGVWGMDLVLCRNVLIYFDAETIARVARRLCQSLSEDGWLLLGAADPLLSDLMPCEVVVTEAGLAYRPRREEREGAAPTARDSIAVAEPVRAAVSSTFLPLEAERMPVPEPDPADADAWIPHVRALANRGDLAAAGRACALALDRHRSSAELTYLHALLLAEAGRPADALAAAGRALYLDRTLVVAHLIRGMALARLGDATRASREFANAEEVLATMGPDDPVPAADGERVGRLLEMARVHRRLLAEGAA